MQRERYRFRAMGCPCELHLYHRDPPHRDAVAALAIGEVLRLERKYTRYRDDSVTSKINRSAGEPSGLEVDDETASLLDYAGVAFEQSGGLFDITSGVLRRVWDFKSNRVPDRSEIEEVRRVIGWQRVAWRRPRIALPLAGMELDFGGYVKEYAADRVAEICRLHGVRSGMVDLGGDLCAIGPHPDGAPWIVGIRHPRSPRTAMATLPLHAGAVASSGDYERFMIVDGRRYGHVLDPRTGWPVEGLWSVSVVARHCLIAGTASTIAMLKGPREGIRWLDEKLALPNLRMEASGRITGSVSGACSNLSGRSARWGRGS